MYEVISNIKASFRLSLNIIAAMLRLDKIFNRQRVCGHLNLDETRLTVLYRELKVIRIMFIRLHVSLL